MQAGRRRVPPFAEFALASSGNVTCDILTLIIWTRVDVVACFV